MDNTLTHHGILGQKWGFRRFQNKDGTLTSAGRKRKQEAVRKYLKTFDEADRQQAITDKKWENVHTQYQGLGKTRLGRIASVNIAMKGKDTDKYFKTWDEAEKLQSLADKKWNEVSKEYQALGKNRIERIMTVHNAQNGKTKSARKYLDAWDAAEKQESISEQKWDEVSKQYKALGKNFLARAWTVSKYS